ncbi:synaptic vesicle 2-related protein-like [Hydractinia symbiolongicarpus]|uniref:synaptic vesicle 2-related protein-like n=1 Tax=Hydractinia symbiolongicarpus TaxID=13093 RepID=UPI0025515D57|nr:synaptic vesicle 2-related protein-like [Hydractinia symbiolongicarpus]
MAVTYTIDDAVDNFGYGKFNIKLTLLLLVMYMMDGIELTLAALVSPRLKCLWGLTSTETALLSSAVFGGMVCGGLYWGELADKKGRKLPMVFCAAMVMYFGLLSGVAFNVWSLFVMRAFVGFFMVCIPPSVVIYSVEFIPMKYRGSVTFGLNLSYSFGAMFASGLAYLVMNSLGWRWYIISCTAPAVILLIFSPWLPESIRYLYITDRYNDLVALLHRMSKENKEKLPKGEVVNMKVIRERGQILELFTPHFIVPSLISFLITNMSSMSYFGTVFLGSQIIQSDKLDCPIGNNINRRTSRCFELTNYDYMWYILFAVGDTVGVFAVLLFVHRISRRVLLCVIFALSAACFPLLYLCLSTAINIFVMFLVRGLLSQTVQLALLFVAELYPTRIRGTAVGFFFGTSRLGVIASTFLSEVLFEYSYLLMTVVYSGLLLLTALVLSCLPGDTRKTKLADK